MTWLFGLAVACTAPPQPAEGPAPVPAPVYRVAVRIDAPGLDPVVLDADVVRPVEDALRGLPDVTALAARADYGRADLIATVTNPAAIEAARAAIEPVLRQLPPSVSTPILSRSHGLPPVLTLALPLDGPDVTRNLERIAGVARVDTCGGREPVFAVDLDRSRLRGLPLDRILAAVEAELAADDPRPLPERLAARPIDGTGHRLRDIAVLRDGFRVRPCIAFTAHGPVRLLTVLPQHGADVDRIVRDAREHAIEAVSPTQGFFAEFLPTPDATGLAVFDLDLPLGDHVPAALADCLRNRDIPAWALAFPRDGNLPALAQLARAREESLLRARVFLATTPLLSLESVRETLSDCTGNWRVSVVAPLDEADHALSVTIVGTDPSTLAAAVGTATERVANRQEITAMRALAPLAGTGLEFDPDAIAASGVTSAQLSPVLELVAGKVTHAPARLDLPVELDMPDRTGPIDQVLMDIYVQSAGGPIALAELARARPFGHVPLYRFDRRRGAAIDLRLRRASDRERVQEALAGVPLPTGISITFGPGLPTFDP